MILLLKLSYRNLWRNRRRTFLTISAMSIATTLLILTLGIYDGMLWDMIDSATEFYHGHVKVTAKNYLERHQLNQTIPEDGLYDKIRSNKEEKGIAGRIHAYALLSCSRDSISHSQPAELFGIDPVEERSVSRLENHIIKGTFIPEDSTHGIVLGKGLAQILEANIGDEIVAMGQGADGSIAADIFYVNGIVDTNDPVRDITLAIAQRKTLQSMFVLEGKLHELSISLRHSSRAKQWAEEMQIEYPNFDVIPWNTFLPQIGQIIEVWGVIRHIFTIIFYFAVVLVSVNTMYMALFERMREYGIMGAIGMKLKRLMAMVVLEGFLMSCIAGIIGGCAGMLGSFYLKNHYIDLSKYITPISYAETTLQPRLRSYPTFDNIMTPILVLILLGIIISLFPAWRLKRFRIVDVLKKV